MISRLHDPDSRGFASDNYAGVHPDVLAALAVANNAMARRLAEAVGGLPSPSDLPGVRIVQPVQTNAVFAVLPAAVTARLQKRFPFYVRDERTGEVRWMCSFDTTPADVDAFAAAIAEELAATRPDAAPSETETR